MNLMPWLLLGGLAGALHAWLLWKARGGALVRMGLVAACLVAAAVAGHVLPAAAGWFLGMLGHGFHLYRRAAR
jgi:hypothetical protein